MSPVILPAPVVIKKPEADMFLTAVSKALSTLSKDDLQQIYLFHDQNVVISFSGDYRPFIGYTMSYNDPDHRLYIYQDCYLLTRIGEALDAQGRDMPGGRVFINRSSACIKDDQFREVVILLLDWQGLDPYKLVMSAYAKLLNS